MMFILPYDRLISVTETVTNYWTAKNFGEWLCQSAFVSLSSLAAIALFHTAVPHVHKTSTAAYLVVLPILPLRKRIGI